MRHVSIAVLLLFGAYRLYGQHPGLESEFLIIQLNLPKQLKG